MKKNKSAVLKLCLYLIIFLLPGIIVYIFSSTNFWITIESVTKLNIDKIIIPRFLYYSIIIYIPLIIIYLIIKKYKTNSKKIS